MGSSVQRKTRASRQGSQRHTGLSTASPLPFFPRALTKGLCQQKHPRVPPDPATGGGRTKEDHTRAKSSGETDLGIELTGTELAGSSRQCQPSVPSPSPTVSRSEPSHLSRRLHSLPLWGLPRVGQSWLPAVSQSSSCTAEIQMSLPPQGRTSGKSQDSPPNPPIPHL